MAAHVHAVADRRGVIEILPNVPDGMIAIASGRRNQLARLIDATARHAYDGTTLLVPGIPEADTDDDALDALIAYRGQIELRILRERARR